MNMKYIKKSVRTAQ